MFKRSEQPLSYMQQLEVWVDEQVIGPIIDAAQPEVEESEAEEVAKRVKHAIKEKMLESYRNGQASAGRASGKARQ